MATKQISEERMAALSARSKLGREAEDAMRHQVAAEHRAFVNDVLRVLAKHSKGFDHYLEKNGPMSRPDVIDKALALLFSEV